MLRRTYTRFLLEATEEPNQEGFFHAWMSDGARLIIGYGRKQTQAMAITDALVDGSRRGKRAAHAAEQLQIELYGTAGLQATAANAASGQ